VGAVEALAVHALLEQVVDQGAVAGLGRHGDHDLPIQPRGGAIPADEAVEQGKHRVHRDQHMGFGPSEGGEAQAGEALLQPEQVPPTQRQLCCRLRALSRWWGCTAASRWACWRRSATRLARMAVSSRRCAFSSASMRGARGLDREALSEGGRPAIAIRAGRVVVSMYGALERADGGRDVLPFD